MTTPSTSAFLCSGCGLRASDEGLPPFRCPRAAPDDDVDHVLVRRLDTDAVPFPTGGPDDPGHDEPFVRFRPLFGSYQRARAAGLDDEGFVARVRALDARIATVDGRGFRVTPLCEEPALAAAVGHHGRVLVKDETGNVAGSHKARHLMGVLLYLELLGGAAERDRPLAISSCGNAALAAAVLARAAGRRLRVFVPTWADARVLGRLRGLGAEVEVCARDTRTLGDPCTVAFRSAVGAGAIPFSCQGTDQALVIEGGMTLGYELLAQAPRPPARLFVQVGGGALASAWAAVADEARRWRSWPSSPALHAVQTEAVAPLARAWARVAVRALTSLGLSATIPPGEAGRPPLEEAARWAAALHDHAGAPEIDEALSHAATHRSEAMWPWRGEAESAASGILDDETYDWLAVVRGMIVSGGYPIVVSEDDIREAHRLGRTHTSIPVDATGTAGFAGLRALSGAGLTGHGDAVVLFTGRDRSRPLSA